MKMVNVKGIENIKMQKKHSRQCSEKGLKHFGSTQRESGASY